MMVRIPHAKSLRDPNPLDVEDLLAQEDECRELEEQHEREEEWGSTAFGPCAISPYTDPGD